MRSPTEILAGLESFKDVTPSGVIGDARRATPEKGEQLMASAARLLADALLAGAPWNAAATEHQPEALAAGWSDDP